MKGYVCATCFGAFVALRMASGCGGGDDGGATLPTATQCFETMDAGSSQTCAFAATNQPDASCPSGFDNSGACPSSGLVGCCVWTLSFSLEGDQTTATSGYCYYSSKAAEAAMAACTGVADNGAPKMWSTLP
jgi:hypothetical protein